LPSTFYLSTANEISGKGYQNFIRFYQYIQNLKWKFIRFYIDKRYYSDSSKVESFIKGNENLFYSETFYPRCFLQGGQLTLLYIMGLFIVSYARFKGAMRL
jgi:hypothetical protein